MPLISKFTRVAVLTVAALGCAGSALAVLAGCPDQYMRMVIPNPVGGIGDVIGRVLAEKVAQVLKQPTVIENRPGATTTPAETVFLLQDAFAKAVMDPTVQERLSALAFTTEVKGSSEASAFIKAELARWKKVVQENNVTSQD